MKENLILLVDADADSVGVVLEAAEETGHGVRLVKTSRDAFRILNDSIDQVEVAIVDVDPGAHGLALLEGISGREERPAVIVLTALEETYMKPIAAHHGATACMGKPCFSREAKIDGRPDPASDRKKTKAFIRCLGTSDRAASARQRESLGFSAQEARSESLKTRSTFQSARGSIATEKAKCLITSFVTTWRNRNWKRKSLRGTTESIRPERNRIPAIHELHTHR